MEELKPFTEHDQVYEDFDDVLKHVEPQGRYQKWLLYAFLSPFCVIVPMIILNTIFMLYEPDHWCAPPANASEEVVSWWKNTSIPSNVTATGDLEFSKCFMFNESGQEEPCQYGWDFDKRDYDRTIPTEFGWVCDKSNYATDAFTAAAFGNAVGSIIFGQAADIFGRKPIFFATVAIHIIFRAVSLYVPSSYYMFMICQFLVGSAYPLMFIAPCMIVAELSDAGYRAWIYALTWMIWVAGMCFLPLLAWLCRDWFTIGVTTLGIAVVLLFYYPFVPESPRWLLTRGRTAEATAIVTKVAKFNRANVSPEKISKLLTELAANLKKKKEKANVWSLLSRRGLAKNTILLTICWTSNQLVYFAIILNTTQMAGNQFLNFFILSTIELPAGYIGGKLVDIAGRRWTQAGFFAACALSLVAAAVTVSLPVSEHVVTTFVLIAKFAITLTFLVVYLQGTEIFPTSLRSTGSGFASTVASFVGISGPSIVALGKFHPGIPYYAMALLSAIGMISAAFLPETLNQKLPETISDADNFGKNRKFWSFRPSTQDKESISKGQKS